MGERKTCECGLYLKDGKCVVCDQPQPEDEDQNNQTQSHDCVDEDFFQASICIMA